MLLNVTAERFQKIMRVLRHRQPDLTVLAEHVHKPHNLSAMLRSCDAVGVGAAHAVAPTGRVATFNETSASAEKWVRLEVHPTLDDAYRVLKEQNMQLLAAHFSPQARDYRDVDYTKPTCILLGNEKDGVSPQAASLADAHIIIPMFGMVPSLNVSVATAVVLFEAQRQRRAAGMFDTPRLSRDAMMTQAFRLLYPRLAGTYDERGLPYPALDEEGNVLEPLPS